MCTGAEIALIASAGATLGGTMLQGKAENKRREAQSTAAQAELDRQAAMEERRAGSFEEALELMKRGRQQGNIDEATEQRTALLQDTALPQQETGYESPAAVNSPRVVQDYARDKQGDANDFAQQLGLARAQLGAWQEGMMPFTEGLRDATFDMDEVARQMRNSGQLGAMEAQNAYANTGNKTALLGNLAVQGGQLGMQAAGANGGMDRLGSLFGGSGGSAGAYSGGVPGNIYG